MLEHIGRASSTAANIGLEVMSKESNNEDYRLYEELETSIQKACSSAFHIISISTSIEEDVEVTFLDKYSVMEEVDECDPAVARAKAIYDTDMSKK